MQARDFKTIVTSNARYQELVFSKKTADKDKNSVASCLLGNVSNTEDTDVSVDSRTFYMLGINVDDD